MKSTSKPYTANLFLLLVCLLCSITIDCFSQISPQGLTPEMLLPQFTEMSPEEASLGRYGAFNVSEYSGSPNIKIPLYTIHSGDISIPIELYYDASGIKVEQDATFVGLGWNLSYGGCINHIVCGKDDFKEDPYARPSYFQEYYSNRFPDYWPCNYDYFCITGKDALEIEENPSKRMAGELHLDMSKGNHIPDIFQASFCGHNLSFIIDKRDSSKIIIVGGDSRKYKIRYWIDNRYPSIFWITDDKGITYKFQAFREFEEYDVYYLIKVYDGDEDMAGKSSVNFEYEREWYDPYKSRSNTRYIETIGEYKGGNLPVELDPLIDHFIGTHVHEINRGGSYTYFKVYPKTITNGVDSIKFNYQRREDLYNTYAISGIHVKSQEGMDLDSINLFYDYYTEQPSFDYFSNKRLRLKNIVINSQKYQLSYNSSTLPSNSMSSSIDYWGYYNAANNKSKDHLCGTPKYILKNDTIRPANYLGEANRYASADSCKIGMLKRITYPTGGYTDYEFEANRFNDNYYYPDASHKISFPPSVYTIIDGTVMMYGRNDPISNNTWTDSICFVASQENYSLKVHGYLNDSSERLVVLIKNSSKNFNESSLTYNKTREYLGDSIPLSLTKGDAYTITISLTANPKYSSSTGAQCWVEHDSVNSDVKALPTTENINGGYSIGGGLRIKTIKNYDANNTYLNGVEYEYEGGKLLIPTVQLERRHIGFRYHKDDVHYSYDYAKSEPSYYYVCSLGVPATVGYSTVTRKDINKIGSIQRKTESEYHNYEYERDQFIQNSFFYCIRGNLNGKLLKKSIYSEKNVLQYSIDCSYDKIRKYFVHFPECVPNFLRLPNFTWADSIGWNVGLFRHNVYWTYLTKKDETFYDSNGNKTTSRVTTYSYDDSNYQVSQQTVSDGQNTDSVRYWYPLNSENPSNGLSYLINRNCLSEVTGVETYKNGVFTGGSKFNYTTYNKNDTTYNKNIIPVVEACYSILPNSGRTNVLEMKVTAYDSYGNIREYEKKDGTPVTVLWSYYHQYPVMEIVGKRYEDIKSDEVVFMENPTRFPTESRIRSVHNTIRQKNPDAHVTAYIYTPWHTVSRIISPNGYEVNYGYDSFGRLIKVGDDSGVLQKYQYNYKIR